MSYLDLMESEYASQTPEEQRKWRINLRIWGPVYLAGVVFLLWWLFTYDLADEAEGTLDSNAPTVPVSPGAQQIADKLRYTGVYVDPSLEPVAGSLITPEVKAAVSSSFGKTFVMVVPNLEERKPGDDSLSDTDAWHLREVIQATGRDAVYFRVDADRFTHAVERTSLRGSYQLKARVLTSQQLASSVEEATSDREWAWLSGSVYGGIGFGLMAVLPISVAVQLLLHLLRRTEKHDRSYLKGLQ